MEDEKKKTEKSESSLSEFVGPRERLKAEPEKPEPTEPTPEPESEPETSEPKTASRLQSFRRWYLSHKKLAIPVTIFAISLILAAIPFTRYSVAGVFIERDIQVQILDSKTGSPVSEATVKARGGSTGITSGTGYATLNNVNVGSVTISVTKKYYKDTELKITVPVIKAKNAFSTKLVPTGRQVKVRAVDYVNQKALADVEIKIADVKAKTDKSGNAIVVLPVGQHSHPAELSLVGYNTATVTVLVSDTEVKQNDFKLTPAGRVYFLSNRSSTIDVMKSNLDGSDTKVVLAGTGAERPNGTVLIASADWKYLALLARRDGSKDKVYMISTSDDKLTTADEGSAEFTLEGWSGNHLIYTVSRTDLNPWQTGAGKLKAYNVSTGKITTLDQTTGGGDVNGNIYEYYSFVFLSGDDVIYGKGWTTQSQDNADFTGKQETLSSISAAGQNHKVVASYDAATKTVDFAPHAPNSIYILVTTQGSNDDAFFDYEVGSQPKQISLTIEEFYKSYPVYYPSPDGKKTAWTEVRDGKNAIVVGDEQGDNSSLAANTDDFVAFGWFGPRYLLVSKDNNELGILGLSGGTIQKVTNYQVDTFYTIPLIGY